MRAILIIDSEGPNPYFNPRVPTKRITNWPSVVHPAGTILVGDNCWIHCVPDHRDVIRAVPDDDECAERVVQHDARMAPMLAARKRAEAEAAIGNKQTQNEEDDLL